tara:strand:+ start:1067 stop:1918 length:852 start_codon:yes stop_codon:yes gene_type:complete
MSVYCGYCGGRGHNKLGCQERKKQARENPEGYLARQVERETEERAHRIANRACTYCVEQGHNRRGCKALKIDKADVLQKNREYRDAFAKAISELGLGTGALVEFGEGSHGERWNRSTMYMITNIAWQNINFLPLAYSGSPSSCYNLLNHNVFEMRAVCSTGYESDATESGWRYSKPSPSDTKWVRLSEVANLLPEELFSPGVNASISRADRKNANEAPESSKMVSPVVGVTFEQPDEYYSLLPESFKSYYNFEPSGKKDRWNSRQKNEDNWIWNGVKRGSSNE